MQDVKGIVKLNGRLDRQNLPHRSPCHSLLNYSIPSASCHRLRPPSPPAPNLWTFKSKCHCMSTRHLPTVGHHPSRFTIRRTSQSTSNNRVYCCVYRRCISHGSVSLGTRPRSFNFNQKSMPFTKASFCKRMDGVAPVTVKCYCLPPPVTVVSLRAPAAFFSAVSARPSRRI